MPVQRRRRLHEVRRLGRLAGVVVGEARAVGEVDGEDLGRLDGREPARRRRIDLGAGVQHDPAVAQLTPRGRAVMLDPHAFHRSPPRSPGGATVPNAPSLPVLLFRRCLMPQGDPMLKGYSLPLSPGGRSSLVPSPPWHYVGDLMVIEYWADPDGRARGAAAGPRAASDRPRPRGGDLRRLAELHRRRQRAARPRAQPVHGVLHRRQRDARRQGGHDLPVHLGGSRLRAHARLVPGLSQEARLGLDDAPLRAPERRRAGAAAGRDVRRHAAPPTTAAWPRARSRSRTSPTPARRTTRRSSSTCATSRGSTPASTTSRRCTSWRARVSRDRSTSEIWEGSASLELFRAPNEEHTALAPVRMGKGFRFTFAYTVDDQSNEGDLRAAD